MPQPADKKADQTDDADASATAAVPDAQSLRDAMKSWQSGDSADAPRSDVLQQDGEEPGVSPGDAVPAQRRRKASRNQTRRYARQRAVQALYQWDHGGVDVRDVLTQFREHQDLHNVDMQHFETLFRGVALNTESVDALLEPALDRPITELDPVERCVLRVAVCELRDCLETPARVVINEAVELTKRFGADQGHKYVNGVIDKVAPILRGPEMSAGDKT